MKVMLAGIAELPVSGPPSVTGGSLWDSYKVAIGLISKTYARRGTSVR